MASQSPTPRVFDMGGVALSHWELVTLLHFLRTASIPGLADDGVEQPGGAIAPEIAKAKMEAAADALAARGLALATQSTDTSPQATVTIATKLVSLIGVCASSHFSVRISSFTRGQRLECYLHAWMGLGVAHIIEPATGSHIFLELDGKRGVVDATRELTAPVNVPQPATASLLGNVPGAMLKDAVRAASTGGASAITRMLEASTVPKDQREPLARAIAAAYRIDEIEIGFVDEQTRKLRQATAIQFMSESGVLLCYRGYDDDTFLAIRPDAQSLEKWLEALIPQRGRS